MNLFFHKNHDQVERGTVQVQVLRSAGPPDDGDPCTLHTLGHLLLGNTPRAEVNLGMT